MKQNGSNPRFPAQAPKRLRRFPLSLERPGPLGLLMLAAALLLAVAGCGGETPGDTERGSGHGASSKQGQHKAGSGGMGRGGAGEAAAAAVPVEVAAVARRTISSFIETNGTLEAENEVDIVARAAAPIVELLVEEGDRIQRGQLLARLDDQEYRAQMEIARVTLNEMQLAFERAQKLQTQALISPENYEAAQSAYETAQAQFEINRLLLSYTQIDAPFDGLVITRYVNFAEQVSNNSPLFRISDFDPLLCPIQVPERDLSLLVIGQPAFLTVEAYPGQRFEASVLRINPVIDAATGTIKVTLAVQALGKLRPGMFARVYVETATRDGALVIPKAALSLESIGDTVYVANGAVVARREIELGFQEGDFVEVVAGLAENEMIVVVGQDGLSDGTPIQILQRRVASPASVEQPAMESAQGMVPAGPGPPAGMEQRGPGGGRSPDFSSMTPEEIEQIKERMRAKGMTEDQIEERLQRMRAKAQQDAQ